MTKEGITWKVDIPANTSARVHVPSGYTIQGMHSLRWASIQGMHSLRWASAEVEGNDVCLTVGSGTYTIKTQKVFTESQPTILQRMAKSIKNTLNAEP